MGVKQNNDLIKILFCGYTIDQLNQELLQAAQDGNLFIIKYCVDHGANIDYHIDDQNFTALVYAAVNGYMDIIDYLIHTGAQTKYLQRFIVHPDTYVYLSELNIEVHLSTGDGYSLYINHPISEYQPETDYKMLINGMLIWLRK